MGPASIHQLHVSRGGVPKLPIEVGVVRRSGLDGDLHAKPAIHGGPDRALSLFALERIEALAREGHPIFPGSTGENITTTGLDWERVVPGLCLRLGTDVVIRITGFAAPCRSIAGSFSDGRLRRLDQLKAPGWSRVYAEVLTEGVIRPGDAIRVEASPHERSSAKPRWVEEPPGSPKGGAMQVSYVNVYVTDLDRSVAFFQKTLGLALQYAAESFGYASFDVGPIRMGLAKIDAEDEDSRALVGRRTGIGFAVPDLDARHRALAERGVAFPMPPAKQPWGGYMALFADPDGNVFYLDQATGGEPGAAAP
ncbi:MAG TPA: MOSC domain-containing protein [Candidatus Limnocylindrales bacterium]|nr:MOSC domain-containing protein [Candidatus Limnocylindrales bacterium]